MKKIGSILVTLAIWFVLSMVLFANGNEVSGKAGESDVSGAFMMGPKMVLSMASELNLTAEQMGKLKKISDEIPVKDSIMVASKADRDSLKAEMKKDAPDENKLNAVIDKINNSHKTAMKSRTKAVLAVRAVLTKEQLEKLRKIMEEKKKERGKNAGYMEETKN